MTRYLALITLLLCSTATSAQAARQLIFDVPPEGGLYEVPVNPRYRTVFYFPSRVTSYTHGKSDNVALDAKQHILSLILDKNVAHATSLTVEWEQRRVGILVKPVANPEEAAPQVLFRNEVASRHQIVAHQMLESAYVSPRRRSSQSSDDSLSAQIAFGKWEGDAFYAAVDVENRGGMPYMMTDVKVAAGSGESLPAELVAIEAPGVGRDDRQALIEPGQRARAIVLLPRATTSSIEAMTVVVSGPAMLRPIMASAEEWILVPKPQEQIEQERRDREAKGRVSLHLTAMGGAMWLEDGLGQDRLDPTTLKGLGVRFTYGFNRFLSVDVEATGAGTGEAYFDDVARDGMQGELTRSAALGRAQVAGLLRLGQEYMLAMRLGAGLQGTRYSSQLTAADGTTTRESSFEFDLTWSLGLGMDVRLGTHLIAGAMISGTAALEKEVRALEAGIHIGYAWQPE